jgi:hypothetical protein
MTVAVKESCSSQQASGATVCRGSPPVQTIRITLFAGTGAVAAVQLDPKRAIAIAGELITAAVLPNLA